MCELNIYGDQVGQTMHGNYTGKELEITSVSSVEIANDGKTVTTGSTQWVPFNRLNIRTDLVRVDVWHLVNNTQWVMVQSFEDSSSRGARSSWEPTVHFGSSIALS